MAVVSSADFADILVLRKVENDAGNGSASGPRHQHNPTYGVESNMLRCGSVAVGDSVGNKQLSEIRSLSTSGVPAISYCFHHSGGA